MYGEWMYAKHSVFYDRLPHYSQPACPPFGRNVLLKINVRRRNRQEDGVWVSPGHTVSEDGERTAVVRV